MTLELNRQLLRQFQLILTSVVLRLNLDNILTELEVHLVISHHCTLFKLSLLGHLIHIVDPLVIFRFEELRVVYVFLVLLRLFLSVELMSFCICLFLG